MITVPAGYAHDRVALSARLLLEDQAPEYLTTEQPCFLLGAQGPDLLFFHGTLPPWRSHQINRLGFLLHRLSGAIWAKYLLSYALQASDEARAWTLGYLCHWASDACCHPYVMSRAEEQKNAHGLLEMSADTLLYRQTNDAGVPRLLPYIKDITLPQREHLAEMISQTLLQVMPQCGTTHKNIMHCIADAGRMHGFIYSPNGKRYERFCKLEGLIGKPALFTSHMPPLEPKIFDPLNLAQKPWGEQMRTDTYLDLLQQSSFIAASMMRHALAFWRGEISLEQALYVMGELRMEDGVFGVGMHDLC